MKTDKQKTIRGIICCFLHRFSSIRSKAKNWFKENITPITIFWTIVCCLYNDSHFLVKLILLRICIISSLLSSLLDKHFLLENQNKSNSQSSMIVDSKAISHSGNNLLSLMVSVVFVMVLEPSGFITICILCALLTISGLFFNHLKNENDKESSQEDEYIRQIRYKRNYILSKNICILSVIITIVTSTISAVQLFGIINEIDLFCFDIGLILILIIIGIKLHLDLKTVPYPKKAEYNFSI